MSTDLDETREIPIGLSVSRPPVRDCHPVPDGAVPLMPSEHWNRQIAIGRRRLLNLADQLGSLELDPLDEALTELSGGLELFYVQVSEFRERILGLLQAALTERSSARRARRIIEELRRPRPTSGRVCLEPCPTCGQRPPDSEQGSRTDGIEELRVLCPELATPTAQFLQCTQEVVDMRNDQAHNAYLQITFHTGGYGFTEDPAAWLNDINDSTDRDRFAARLQSEIDRLVREYIAQIEEVLRMAQAIHHAVDTLPARS